MYLKIHTFGRRLRWLSCLNEYCTRVDNKHEHEHELWYRNTLYPIPRFRRCGSTFAAQLQTTCFSMVTTTYFLKPALNSTALHVIRLHRAPEFLPPQSDWRVRTRCSTNPGPLETFVGNCRTLQVDAHVGIWTEIGLERTFRMLESMVAGMTTSASKTCLASSLHAYDRL